MSGLSLLLPDYIDRDFHRRNRTSVLKPVCGVPILRPAHSRPIVRGDSISMVGDRSLQYVDSAWPVFMVVNGAEDASRLDCDQTHSKLTPCHAFDLRAKVNRCKQLHRYTYRLRCHLFVSHLAFLSVLPGPNVRAEHAVRRRMKCAPHLSRLCSSDGLDCAGTSVTPLRFARNPIVIAIHFGTRAVANEVGSLSARRHFRAHCAAVAGVARQRRRKLARSTSSSGLDRGGSSCVLGVPIRTKSDDSSEHERATQRGRWAPPQRTSASRMLDARPTGPHHTNSAPLSVGARLDLKRDELVGTWPCSVARKCRNVDEQVTVLLGWSDEPEAAVIIPLGQSTMRSHRSGLTLHISRPKSA